MPEYSPMTSARVCFLGAFCLLSLALNSVTSWGADARPLRLARDGHVFEVFQFPRNQMPRIDGQTADWEMVPERYVYDTKWLNDTEDGHGTEIDPSDLDVKVRVGWVKGLNRLYVLYEAYDDFWDFGRFNPKGYRNDIFEIAVDGDLSGGPFIFNPVYDPGKMRWASDTDEYVENHLRFSGVHAQNYHFFTPPVNNAWVMVWGGQPWIADFPHANYAYDYDFSPGESGRLVMELWLTPYDYAPHSGPKEARESVLEENGIIGLSWSILDFDGGKRDGHVNLAHDVRMVKDASYLCAFKLMPIENELQPELRAEWSFEVIDMERRLVAFKDESIGEVERWSWDFGSGETSSEQHPVVQFENGGVHKVVTLTVEGPKGTSKRTRYREVLLR